MKRAVLIVLILLMTACVEAQIGSPQSLPPGDNPPPTVFDRIKNAGNAADFDSAAYAIVVDSSVNRVNDLGITYTDSYILYKALTDDGCKKLAVQTWHYEPLTNYVEIHEVNIIRGEKSIPVSVDEIIDLPAPQRGIFWGDRNKSLQLPRLLAGDGIEIKTYRKGYSYALLDPKTSEPDDENYIPPMRGQYFDIVLFEATVPIVEKKYILKLPADKRLHSQVYNGPMYTSTSYNADTTTYSWWTKDMPAWEPQQYRPDDTDIITKVVLATVESWEAKSRWFFDVNEPQFEYTDAIKAKVDEIFAKAGVAKGTEEEKAFELVHWVAQNIRYSGQTMGKGEGYTLHSGAMIFEQRSGVCKDIAGMLITMMRAAGLDSYGAMTMAGSRIEEIPADQFNHCVVALKKNDGSFEMYDPTWVPFQKDVWSKYESEQHYLIGNPEGESLNRIRYSPPEESSMRITNTARIFKDCSLEGTLELSGNGTRDSRLRGMLNRGRLADLNNYLAGHLHYVSDRIEIISYEHGDLLDFHKNMWWKIKYRIPEYALLTDNGYEFKSPLVEYANEVQLYYGTIDWPKERRDDLFFYSTRLIDGNETIKLPKGFKVEKPKNSKKIDDTYAYFKGESKMSKDKLITKFTAKINRRQVPSEGYADFCRAMKEAKKFSKTVFRAEKGGKK